VFALHQAEAVTGSGSVWVRHVAHQRLAQAAQLVIVRTRRVRREGGDADPLCAEVRYAGLCVGILHVNVRSQACPSPASYSRWYASYIN